MKLWVFSEPDDSKFAPASGVGTWVKRGDPPKSVRVQPLVIEWEPGGTRVGDFTWVGSAGYMIKRSVAEDLMAAGFKGFEPGPVEMAPNRDYKRRKRNMIQLPYEGPEVVDFWVAKRVPFNRDRTTIRIRRGEHGKPVYILEGIETIEHGDWHPDTGVLERIRVPRTPGMGLYVDVSNLDNCDVFKVKELPAAEIVTDRFRDFVLDKGYTNIDFFEVGETVE